MVEAYSLVGTVVGLYEVGCAFGALSCLFLGHRLGRVRTIFVVVMVAAVGIILQSTPFSLVQLIVARIINGETRSPYLAESRIDANAGFGVGGITATVPMYVSECSKAADRGTMVMLSGWFAAAGLVLAQ